VLVHRDLLIDVFAGDKKVSVGVFGSSTRKLLLGRGDFSGEWMRRPLPDGKAEFLTATHVVALRRSARYDFTVYAALPVAEVYADFTRIAKVLLPAGLVAGVLLAWAALVRWRRPRGEFIRPDIFIPVAEDNGLIGKITQRVIRLVQQDAATLFKHHPESHIAINLSAHDMHCEKTVDLLMELAHATGAVRGNIVVEATERGFMEIDVARSVVNKLRRYGFQVAIDDFGTGYSSLSYLETLKVDFLKIDKCFVDTINTDAPTSLVVLHIIELAKDLNIKMIAEGVETEEQARFPRNRGVQYAQGWLFGKPMPFADFSRRFQQQAAPSQAAQVLSIRRAAASAH
jgi:sensor c-di-GMP phosphodiesterase-like protein